MTIPPPVLNTKIKVKVAKKLGMLDALQLGTSDFNVFVHFQINYIHEKLHNCMFVTTRKPHGLWLTFTSSNGLSTHNVMVFSVFSNQVTTVVTSQQLALSLV